MVDKLKLVLAALLVAAGVAGFYLLSDQALVVRILCVLAGLVAGGFVARLTETGRGFAAFAGEAVTEAKKVVWPSRKETLQTTGIVFAFVAVMALLLWGFDSLSGWVVYDLILGWK